MEAAIAKFSVELTETQLKYCREQAPNLGDTVEFTNVNDPQKPYRIQVVRLAHGYVIRAVRYVNIERRWLPWESVQP